MDDAGAGVADPDVGVGDAEDGAEGGAEEAVEAGGQAVEALGHLRRGRVQGQNAQTTALHVWGYFRGAGEARGRARSTGARLRLGGL